MGHDKDFVEQLTEASVEARQALHELLAGVKEARKVIKELEEVIQRNVGEEVNTAIGNAVHTQLEEMGKATRQAMDDSVAKVQKEFDKLTNIMMTGNTRGRTSDGFNIAEVIRKGHM